MSEENTGGYDSNELLTQINELNEKVNDLSKENDSQKLQIVTLAQTGAELQEKLQSAQAEIKIYQNALSRLENIERAASNMVFRTSTPGLQVGGRFPNFTMSYSGGSSGTRNTGLDD